MYAAIAYVSDGRSKMELLEQALTRSTNIEFVRLLFRCIERITVLACRYCAFDLILAILE